jgi:hypothetical protein
MTNPRRGKRHRRDGGDRRKKHQRGSDNADRRRSSGSKNHYRHEESKPSSMKRGRDNSLSVSTAPQSHAPIYKQTCAGIGNSQQQEQPLLKSVSRGAGGHSAVHERQSHHADLGYGSNSSSGFESNKSSPQVASAVRTHGTGTERVKTLSRALDSMSSTHSVSKKPKVGTEDSDTERHDFPLTTPSVGEQPKFCEADRERRACEVFGKACFHTSELMAKHPSNVEARKNAFGKKTVGELIRWWNRADEEKRRILLDSAQIGRQRAAENYLSDGTTIETLLHDQIIALNAQEEVKVATDCFVDLNTPRGLAAVVQKAPGNRTDKIAFVLGPSGVGKTVCALKQVSTYGWTFGKAFYTTLYAKISQLNRFHWKGKGADRNLLAWVQDRLETTDKLQGLYKKGMKLHMNVAVVLDEAGSEDLHKFFEDKDKIYSIYRLFGQIVHPEFKFRLIVCGTGLTAQDLSSGKDVGLIRLGSWSQEDLADVAKAKFPDLDREAIEAIYRQPILCSLTTNARSAWFLLKAVSNDIFLEKKAIKYSVRDGWDKRLEVGLASIVDYVVDNYTGMNGINDLDPRGRRLVVAWVFYAVEQAKIRSGEEEPFVPTFENLDPGYVRIANAMIHLNVENRSGKVQRIDGDQPSIFLSAALTIILLRVLNAPATAAGSLSELERVAAVYLLRQEVLKHVLEYLEARRLAQDASKASRQRDVDELDKRLSRLQLVARDKRVQRPSTAKHGDE